MQSSHNPQDDKSKMLLQLKAAYMHDLDAYNQLVTDLEALKFQLDDQVVELASLKSESEKQAKNISISQLKSKITLFNSKLESAETQQLLTKIDTAESKIEELELEVNRKKVSSSGKK